MQHHAREIIVMISGGLIDIGALGAIAAGIEGHWARLAIGAMIPATAAILVGIVLSRVQDTRTHFDRRVAVTQQRLGELEERDRVRMRELYNLGLRHSAAVNGSDSARVGYSG